jgi:hypothetical protein
LDDVPVVELSEALAGPYCAMLLGDFGGNSDVSLFVYRTAAARSL